MAQIFSNLAMPWTDGATVVGGVFRLPWGDGSTIYSNGGTYTAPPAPGGGVPAVPNTDPRYTIASRALYVSNPGLLVKDLRDDSVLEVNSVSIAWDESSPFWTVDLDGPASLWDALSTGTQPVSVSVAIGAKTWNFLIESATKSRSFSSYKSKARGRSLSALAAEPNQFSKNWIIDGDTTAFQVASSANLLTNLEIGWTIQDWLIPDKVFSFSGTPLGVVKRLADAVGALLISDTADYKVSVVSRYPLMPNEWPLAAPDVELAIAATLNESFEVLDNPNYDGVYVLGHQQGFYAFAKLAGTTGANLSPMVTDQLLTDLPANAERGRSILGASGKKQMRSLSLPVLTGSGEPGVFEGNWLVRVLDESETWWGLVRRVAVQATYDSAVQSISLERQLEYVPGTVLSDPLPPTLHLAGAVADQALTGGAYFTINIASYFVDGAPPYTISIRSGTLPAWLQLDGITGDVFGTTPGSFTPFSMQFRCTDAISSTADTNAILFDLAVTSSSGLVAAKLGSTDYAKTAANPTASWVTGTGTTVGGTPRRLMAGPSVVMAILTGGGLARSTDGGNTWATDSFFTPANAYTDPVWNGSTWTIFYMGSVPYKRYSSSDGGATWTPTNFTGGYPASTGIAPTMIAMNGSKVLSARPSGSPTGELYVYKSTDGGVTWSAILADAFVDSAVRHILHITGTTWVLVNDDVIYRSTDDGDNWTFFGFASSVSVKGIATDGSNVVLVDGNAVDYSNDAGVTWSSSSLPGSKQGEDLIYDGSVFVTLGSFGSTSNDICVSADGGATWGAHTGPGLGYNRLVNLI